MLRPRIIPCLLIHNGGLVKTKKFSEPKYVGDPINAVRIFNEKEADELMVLDIDATVKGNEPNFKLIEKLASECRMPLCYGGGITNVEQVQQLVNIGVEKAAISSECKDTSDENFHIKSHRLVLYIVVIINSSFVTVYVKFPDAIKSRKARLAN